MESLDEPEHPCTKCGEPTLNDTLCRECDIEALLKGAECEHCGRHIWNDNASAIGMMPFNHAPECPLYCKWCGSRGCLQCGDIR